MPLSWTIPGTAAGMKPRLVDHARRSLPRWYGKQSRIEEEFQAQGEIMSMVAAVQDDRDRSGYVLLAEGIWLEEHARDEGLWRQANESNDALRERIRNPQATVTRPAILVAINALLVADGMPGTATMVRLPRDAAFCKSTPAIAADAAGMGFASSPRTVPVTDGFGFRCASTPPPSSFIVILPSGTPTATRTAVLALIASYQAAGFKSSVEVGP